MMYFDIFSDFLFQHFKQLFLLIYLTLVRESVKWSLRSGNIFVLRIFHVCVLEHICYTVTISGLSFQLCSQESMWIPMKAIIEHPLILYLFSEFFINNVGI